MNSFKKTKIGIILIAAGIHFIIFLSKFASCACDSEHHLSEFVFSIGMIMMAIGTKIIIQIYEKELAIIWKSIFKPPPIELDFNFIFFKTKLKSNKNS